MKNEMGIYLGEWIVYLYDQKIDQYYAPVLRVKQFRDHMARNKHEGYFQPDGCCEATAPWAQLLHSLVITPKTNILNEKERILDRQLAHTVYSEDNGPQLLMEVEGEVICHLVNLFSIGRVWPQRCLRQDNPDASETTFGKFQWSLSKKGITVSYTPGSEGQLRSLHEPFPHLRSSYRAPTFLEKGNVLRTYDLAIHGGITDTSMVWPDRAKPLSKRLEKLFSNLNEIDHFKFSRAENTEALATPEWLQEFGRILRRATADGGSNREFFDAIVDRMRHNASTIAKEQVRAERLELLKWQRQFLRSAGESDEKVEQSLESESEIEIDEESVKRLIHDGIRWLESEGFMFEREPFEFYYYSGESPGFGRRIPNEDLIRNCITEVCEGYKTEPSGSWKHSLSENATAIVSLIMMERSYFVHPQFTFVRFDQNSPLWSKDLVRLQPSTRAGGRSN